MYTYEGNISLLQQYLDGYELSPVQVLNKIGYFEKLLTSMNFFIVRKIGLVKFYDKTERKLIKNHII